MDDDADRQDTDQKPGETPDAQDAATDEGQTDDQQGDVTTDDPAELRAAIKRLQAKLKAVNAESKERRLKLKEYEEAEQERQRESMTEIERLQADLAEAQTAVTEREALQTAVEELNTVITAQVEAMLADLDIPDHVQALMEPMTPADKLKHLVDNRKAYQKKPKKPDYNAGDKSGGRNQPKPKKRVRVQAINYGL